MPKSQKVAGGSELRTALKQATARMVDAVEGAVAAETRQVRDDMRRFAPELTGELRGSMRAITGGLEGEAVAMADHAQFVENGTKKMKAQPFALPAAELARRRFKNRVADAVGSVAE